ncbi:MAG: right-handed parallel beta-helix repeat-containing protein [Thermoplasmata archaeon]|nr:MAG: right-handed parallel beta-helix repeat-containing protein [Thermoplasmata archaeon]
MKKIHATLIAVISLISMFGFYNFESEIVGGGFSISGGHITENTTWYHSQSPYYIEGDVYVDENITLTIEPGVDVRFNGGNGLYIDGFLNAVGTSNRIINFSSNKTSPTTSDWEGIQINSTGHAEISYCNITYANYSICLSHTSNNNITNNNISSGSIYGIYLDHSQNNHIKANNIFSIWFSCIRLSSSSNNDIIDNDIFQSELWDGINLLSSSNNNSIVDNRIFSHTKYGIYLDSSSNNSIIKNHVYSNGEENIYIVLSSDNNLIMENNVSDSNIGIELSSSENNTVICNKVFSHSTVGIFLLSSSNNDIMKNNILENNLGIHMFSNSHYNQICHNNIMDNTNQALDDQNDNIWNHSYPKGGNYWSDFDESGEGAYDEYIGEDQDMLGSDGIVDNGTIGGGGKNPYIIDSDSQDNYPLIHPYLENSTYLQQGWNLISIPFLQSNTSLEAVLQSIGGEYNTLQYYNASDRNKSWKHHHISKPYHLNDFTEINHKIGFWIHIITSGGILFNYSGKRPFQNQTIPLHPGWNMVGYPSLNRYNRTDGLNNLTFGDHVDVIWSYNAAIQKWEKMGESDNFIMGRGYYIHAKSECTWEVPL